MTELLLYPLNENRFQLDFKGFFNTKKKNPAKQNSVYLEDAFETIKLNYRCEENPPGSGNFKCDITKESDKQLDKTNKIRLKEIKDTLKATKLKNKNIRAEMDKLPAESPEWKKLQSQIDTDTEYKLEKYAKILSYKHPEAPSEFKPFLQDSDKVINGLNEEQKKGLSMYVHGYGNAQLQGMLATWKGKVPGDTEESIKQEIGKRYSFSGKYDPNDSFHVKQFNATMEYVNTITSRIQNLDSILENSKTKQDIVVQTGISSVLLGIDNLKPGDNFEIPTFVSTTRSETIANGFALRKFSSDKKDYKDNPIKNKEPVIPMVLEMNIKLGSRALALENFALDALGADADLVIGSKGIAGTGSQQEVLLARGTKCKVRDIQDVTFRGKTIRKVIVDAEN